MDTCGLTHVCPYSAPAHVSPDVAVFVWEEPVFGLFVLCCVFQVPKQFSAYRDVAVAAVLVSLDGYLSTAVRVIGGLAQVWGRINERINLMDTQVAVLGFPCEGMSLPPIRRGLFRMMSCSTTASNSAFRVSPILRFIALDSGCSSP